MRIEKIAQSDSAKESIYHSAYLLLTIIFLTTLGCIHNINASNREKISGEFKSEIVSIRNPSIVIQPPVKFAWLPESIEAYYYPGFKDSPIQKIIHDAIIESLITNDDKNNESTYAIELQNYHKEKRTNTQPQDLIHVKSWKWTGANFGAAGFLKEITLVNKSNQNVTDLKIHIDYLGTTGPKEGYGGPSSIFVIHDLLPAKSEKTFRDVNIGYRHPNARKINIRVLNVKTIIDELLIGYTLLLKSAISDYGMNRKYDITSSLSENIYDLNVYEIGNVIVDVVDAKSRTLVWRGALQAHISFDIPENERQERINLAVEKLTNKFLMSIQTFNPD